MADKKFSELTATTTVYDTDIIVQSNGSQTTKTTILQLKDKFKDTFFTETEVTTTFLAKTGDNSNTTTTFSEAGTLANITSTSTLAINLGKIMKFFSFIGTTVLTTTATTITTAINELVTKIGNLTTLTTTSKTSAVSAINELDGKIKLNTLVAFASGTTQGELKLENGFMVIWGRATSLSADGATGGYSSATLTFTTAFVGNVIGLATPIATNGVGEAAVHAISTTTIKVGSNWNPNGGIGWVAIGNWK